MFTRDRTGTVLKRNGPDRLLGVDPKLDLLFCRSSFGSVLGRPERSRVNRRPIRSEKSDRIRLGPVPCKHSLKLLVLGWDSTRTGNKMQDRLFCGTHFNIVLSSVEVPKLILYKTGQIPCTLARNLVKTISKPGRTSEVTPPPSCKRGGGGRC